MNKGPAPALAEKADNSPEDKAKEMEKNVHHLIEVTAEALAAKDYRRALEKAKEAGKAERSLCKFRESKNLMDQISLELTFAVTFNVANAYYHNKVCCHPSHCPAFSFFVTTLVCCDNDCTNAPFSIVFFIIHLLYLIIIIDV